MTDELMTVHELEEFLRLDRTTIYGLLKEGRLPGFKVGGQWRFIRHDIDVWLKEQGVGLSAIPSYPISQVLPIHHIQSMQDIFAEALRVGSLVTQLDGQPLTQISNPCAFCDLVLSTAPGFQQCVESWRKLAAQGTKAQLYECHAGLLYSRSQIKVKDEFIAMVFAGQVVINGDLTKPASKVEELATVCGLAPAQLHDALPPLCSLASEETERLMDLLERLGRILSDIGQERLVLLHKLNRIAELAAL